DTVVRAEIVGRIGAVQQSSDFVARYQGVADSTAAVVMQVEAVVTPAVVQHVVDEADEVHVLGIELVEIAIIVKGRAGAAGASSMPGVMDVGILDGHVVAASAVGLELDAGFEGIAAFNGVDHDVAVAGIEAINTVVAAIAGAGISTINDGQRSGAI